MAHLESKPVPATTATVRQYPLHRPIVLTLLVTLLLAAGAAAWWVIHGQTPPPIASVRLASGDGTGADLPGAAPPLRIAVAAMISPKITYESYEQLLRHLGDRLGRPVRLVQRKSYREVNDLVERREVDLAFVCSGPYVTGHAKFGMELLAAPVVHGELVYRSYVIVHRDSPIQSFEQLRGQAFAFTDPDSNTGCLVPRFLLARRRETPKRFFGDTFYTHSHDNSIQAVAQGTATAAAVDSLIWEYTRRVNPALTSQTRILFQSPPYGIPPVVVHPAMPVDEKAQLQRLFLSLHRDKAAQGWLEHLQIDRFERVEDRLYESVREMQKWIEEHQE